MATERRHEPDRRLRILEVTLEIIARNGVAGATYRTVAEAAGVPLGSMTYHFPTREDLLFEAFQKFADDGVLPLENLLADPKETPVDALTRVVLDVDGPPDRVLLAELYALAFRHERFAELMRQWMRRARSAIAAAVDSRSPNVIDAVQEGLALHRYFLPEEVTEQVIRTTFEELLPSQRP